jgi:hypothetical protein
MIKTTIKTLIEAQPCVQMLLNARLPVKAAYAVSKLARAIQPELEQFDKTKAKLFTDAGCTIGGEGSSKEWTHKDKAIVEKVGKDVDDLMTAECEINALPLDLEQFGAAELPGAAFLTLDFAMKKD